MNKQSLKVALSGMVAVLAVATLGILYFVTSGGPAASQTPANFDAFKNLDAPGNASLQIKFTYLGPIVEPRYSTAFTTEGHALDLAKFVPYRHPQVDYFPDDLVLDGQPVVFTFSASTSEMQTIIDGIDQVPGATDGLDSSEPRASLTLQAVPATGDIGYEDFLDPCDTWRVLKRIEGNLDLGNTAGLDVIETALSTYTGFDGDLDGLNEGCDPCDDTSDCDGDGKNDGDEILELLDPLDPDTDGDLVGDGAEGPCGADPLDAGAIPERVDGAFAGVSDDGDVDIDEALPPGSEGYDCDGDGYPGGSTGLSDEEDRIFSTSSPSTQRDQDPCGGNGWPSELFSGLGSENKINLQDVTSFVMGTPPFKFGSVKGGPGYDERWNLFNGGDSVDVIDLQDITAILTGPVGGGGRDKPPMLGGATRTFDGPTCPWPP